MGVEVPDSDPNKSKLWNMVDKIVGSGDQKSGTSLPTTLILLGVAVVIFSIMGVVLVLSRRKVARLASQMRKLEEEKFQVEESIKLELLGSKRSEMQARINKLDLDTRDLQGQIDGLGERNRHALEDIAKIADWDDFVVIDKRDKS